MAIKHYAGLDTNYLPTDGSVPVALGSEAVELIVASGRVSQAVSLEGYDKIAFVTEGDTNTSIDFLEILGNESTDATLEIVKDINASSGYALKMTGIQKLVFGTRISYVPDILKKITLKAKKDSGNTGNLYASVVSYANGQYINKLGNISVEDYVSVVDTSSLTDSYTTNIGYIKGVGTSFVEPASNPNSPSELPSSTDEIALILEATGASDIYYIDVISLEEVENTIRDIPDGQGVYDSSQNFNTRNDRITTTPANPVVTTPSTCTLNGDGSVDITFTWTHTGSGDAYNIDGFGIYVNSSDTSTPPTFTDSAVYVDMNTREYTLYGVTINKYYTVGVQAYRSIDHDVALDLTLSEDVLRSAIVQTTPYRPANITPSTTSYAIQRNVSSYLGSEVLGSIYVHGYYPNSMRGDISGQILFNEGSSDTDMYLAINAQSVDCTDFTYTEDEEYKCYLVLNAGVVKPAIYDINTNTFKNDTETVSTGVVIGYVVVDYTHTGTVYTVKDTFVYETAKLLSMSKTTKLQEAWKYLSEATDQTDWEARVDDLGIENSFTFLAAYNAFIKKLATNELTLSQNGSIASSYADNGEMKRYQKGMIDDNTLPEDFGGFLLEASGSMELVRVRARDGVYSGVLDSSDNDGTLLYTQKYELGRALPVSPRTYYLVSEILPHFPDKASKEVSINEGSYVHAFKLSKIKSDASIGFDVRTLDNSRTVALPQIKGSSRVVLYNSTPYISKVEYSKNGGAFTEMSRSVGVSVSQGDDIRIRQSYNNPNAFVGLGQGTRQWYGMTTLGNDVYACVNSGDIYKQTNGTGDFVALGQGTRQWRGMTTLGNDIYACVWSGDIYKQTNGTGNFVALGQASRGWWDMTTLGNDIYACVYNGDIYKQTNGTGNFVALGQGTRPWTGMTTLGNDVYACVQNGDIYKQTNGTGNFVALGQTSRNWGAMTTLGNDVYACVVGGDIFKQTNGTGNFVALGQTSRNWRGMTTLGNDVYACLYSGNIYKQTYNTAHQSTISIALPNTEALVLACTNTPTANGTYDDFNGEVITFDTATSQSEKSVVIKSGGTTLFDSALNLYRTFKTVYDNLEGIGTYALDDSQSTFDGTQAGYVVKSQNQLTFLTLAKAVIATIGSTTYTKIDAILYLLGQTRGVKTATLLPETGASVGTAQNPYNEGHFENIVSNTFSGSLNGNVTGSLNGNVTGNVTGNVAGNVNDAGTSNRVYGAVFN